MFKKLIRWFQQLLRGLFSPQKKSYQARETKPTQPPPPLDDTDLEFLFTELLEGAYQARGQVWALRWLENIENRVPEQRWLEWLHKFGDRLLASTAANNEIAARMVNLGELNIGPVGDTAYNLGMQLLTRNQPEPIWEYSGPDGIASANGNGQTSVPSGVDENLSPSSYQQNDTNESPPADGEYQTITLDQLFELLQQDASLRQTIAQQFGVETDDPETIIEAVVNQLQTASADSGDNSGGTGA